MAVSRQPRKGAIVYRNNPVNEILIFSFYSNYSIQSRSCLCDSARCFWILLCSLHEYHMSLLISLLFWIIRGIDICLMEKLYWFLRKVTSCIHSPSTYEDVRCKQLCIRVNLTINQLCCPTM